MRPDRRSVPDASVIRRLWSFVVTSPNSAIERDLEVLGALERVPVQEAIVGERDQRAGGDLAAQLALLVFDASLRVGQPEQGRLPNGGAELAVRGLARRVPVQAARAGCARQREGERARERRGSRLWRRTRRSPAAKQINPIATRPNVPGSGTATTKFTMFAASTRLVPQSMGTSKLTSTSSKPDVSESEHLVAGSALPRCRPRQSHLPAGRERSAQRGEIQRGTRDREDALVVQAGRRCREPDPRPAVTGWAANDTIS